ncbi:MAG TPA: oligosaccharide flippase family protein [Bacteroidia bacterium]|jgi:O-antigen/teichoic acid export membrane protein|nr:oligosaccharide flippase family protein [Bacteroidia bacterium]
MQQKKFLTNLGILLLLNLLVKPFWMLGIERVVQNQVGNENYGEYFALFNFSFLFNIVLDFGITNFNNKNIAQNNHLLTKHFSSLFVLKLILALIYILGSLVIGLAIGYDVRLTKLLLLLGFNQFLISMVLYLRSNLQGLHLFKTDSVVSVLDRMIMITVCAVVLWGKMFEVKMDIMLFAYIQTGAYFITALIAFLMVVGKTETLKLSLSYPFALMILKKSFPFAVLVLLMTFYNRIDAVMLERILPAHNSALSLRVDYLKTLPGYKTEPFHELIDRLNDKVVKNGADQAGIYAKAFRLLDATNMIAYLFSVILLPTFSRMLKFKESVEPLVKLAFNLIITPALVIAIGCCFYSRELMDLLYTDQVEESAIVFGPLMCCFVAISTTYIFGTLLTANGNLLYLNTIASFAMVINISLNLLLIPRFQAPGSAFVSLTTQVVMALAQVWIVQRVFRFRINYRLLITLGVFILGVIGINYLSKMFAYHFAYHEATHPWFLHFVVMVIACVLWAFLIGQLSVKSIFRMAKYG